MNATKSLSIKKAPNSFSGIINSCKQYFANMTSSQREQFVRDNIDPIQTVPFYKLEAVTPVEEVAEDIKEAFGNLAKRTYVKMLESERGKKILSKARKYNIPYDKSEKSIDWLKLISEVDGYESMLEEAKEQGITWDIGEYDPVGLRQALEDNLSCAIKEKREAYWDTYRDRC